MGRIVDLRRSFRTQRNHSTARGIVWGFTFEQWLDVWYESGHLHQRGRGRGCYVMARHGDVGPYMPSNVSIILYEQNAADSRANHPRTTAELSGQSIGRGRGWTFVRGGYQVSVAKKYIGRYRRQVDAEMAYQVAVAERTARLGITGSGRDLQGFARNDR